jgi:cytochrome b561
MRSNADGYGTVAVLIHWTSAVLIVVLLGTGFRAGFSEDVAAKAAALRVHVPVALLVLALTVLRLVWWWRVDRKPAPEPGGAAWQEAVARWTHRGLYALILILLTSGIAMSVLSGLPDALFGTAAFPDLADLAPRAGHGIGARLLAALVVLHAAAALYHHWGLRDRTLRRMWFGAR